VYLASQLSSNAVVSEAAGFKLDSIQFWEHGVKSQLFVLTFIFGTMYLQYENRLLESWAKVTRKIST
jgi:hypothetical protein